MDIHHWNFPLERPVTLTRSTADNCCFCTRKEKSRATDKCQEIPTLSRNVTNTRHSLCHMCKSRISLIHSSFGAQWQAMSYCASLHLSQPIQSFQQCIPSESTWCLPWAIIRTRVAYFDKNSALLSNFECEQNQIISSYYRKYAKTMNGRNRGVLSATIGDVNSSGY